MQQVANWLEKLGFGQYAQRFAENDIDFSVLPHLTEENLKELGISLGHRVKLLAAIRELGETLITAEPDADPRSTVAGALHYAPMIHGDCGINQIAAERRAAAPAVSAPRRHRRACCIRLHPPRE